MKNEIYESILNEELRHNVEVNNIINTIPEVHQQEIRQLVEAVFITGLTKGIEATFNFTKHYDYK